MNEYSLNMLLFYTICGVWIVGALVLVVYGISKSIKKYFKGE